VPDEKKEPFINAKESKSPVEIVSFLGHGSVLGRPHRKTFCGEPLRRLARSKAKWNWMAEQHTAFESLKQSLIDRPLAFFDLNKRTKVTVDASPTGVAYTVTQHPHNRRKFW